MPTVDPIDLAVEMLDVEANKNIPDYERARAMFLRLVAPSIVDACETVAKKYGTVMLVSSMGMWLGELVAGMILPQFAHEPPPPEEVLDAAIEHNVHAFERIARLLLEEFKQSQGEGDDGGVAR